MAIIGEGSVELLDYLFEHQPSLSRYWEAQKSSSGAAVLGESFHSCNSLSASTYIIMR